MSASGQHPPGEPELEGLLRDAAQREHRAQPARPAFRDDCRRRFLEEAASPDLASQPSGALRNPGGVADPIETILRGDPRPPQARAGFREECVRRFLDAAAGEAPVPQSPGTPGSPGPYEPGPYEPGPYEAVNTGRRGRLIRFAAVAAGIAAALLVTFLPDRPRWQVVELGGTGTVQVAGQARSAAEGGRLTHELGLGAPMSSGQATLDLALGDWLTLHVLAGTEMEFGELEDLEEGRVLQLALTRGEIYLTTVPDATPSGTVITIETRDGLVEVTGTSLGVMAADDVTCVCVARGTVVVRDARTGTRETVEERSSYLFSCQPDSMIKRVPFGAADDVEHDGHTGPLLDFAARP